MFETVVVPLDGSARAELALPYGRDEAFRHGARIVLVRVVPRPAPRPAPISRGEPRSVRPIWPASEPQGEEREWLAYLDGVRERFALPESARVVVLVGDPTRRLLDEARQYPHPLIVMAPGDAKGSARSPLSEVARRAVLEGGVPILTVGEPAPQTRRLAQLAVAPVAGRLRVVS